MFLTRSSIAPFADFEGGFAPSATSRPADISRSLFAARSTRTRACCGPLLLWFDSDSSRPTATFSPASAASGAGASSRSRCGIFSITGEPRLPPPGAAPRVSVERTARLVDALLDNPLPDQVVSTARRTSTPPSA